MGYILLEEHGFVGLLTINRPNALNALNSEVIAELDAKLDSLVNSDIRCLVITGAGEKAFVAGADIAEMMDMNPEQAAAFSGSGNAVMAKIEQLPIPVIAAVNGFALGGGCELSLACDIRLASERAVFGLPEVGLGILPGYGGVQRLVRTIGAGQAKELAMTARRIKAEEAYALGLVNHVYPADELLDAALQLGKTIAENAPIGVKAVKEVANASVGKSIAETVGLEQEAFGKCFATQDQKQAMKAFVEKSKPAPFTGE